MKPKSWRFTKLNGKQPVIVNDSTGGRITYLDDDISKEHAYLIAAAPELLDALRELVAWADPYAIAPHSSANIKNARALLNKVDGTPPTVAPNA